MHAQGQQASRALASTPAKQVIGDHSGSSFSQDLCSLNAVAPFTEWKASDCLQPVGVWFQHVLGKKKKR